MYSRGSPMHKHRTFLASRSATSSVPPDSKDMTSRETSSKTPSSKRLQNSELLWALIQHNQAAVQNAVRLGQYTRSHACTGPASPHASSYSRPLQARSHRLRKRDHAPAFVGDVVRSGGIGIVRESECDGGGSDGGEFVTARATMIGSRSNTCYTLYARRRRPHCQGLGASAAREQQPGCYAADSDSLISELELALSGSLMGKMIKVDPVRRIVRGPGSMLSTPTPTRRDLHAHPAEGASLTTHASYPAAITSATPGSSHALRALACRSQACGGFRRSMQAVLSHTSRARQQGAKYWHIRHQRQSV